MPQLALNLAMLTQIFNFHLSLSKFKWSKVLLTKEESHTLMVGPFLSEVSAMLIAELFISVDVVVVVEEVVHLLTDVIYS